MFRGYFEHTINNQGRVSLPARFRQILEENFSNKVVVAGFDDHIEVYPDEEYKKFESEDMRLSRHNRRVLEFLSVQYHNVFETEIDGAGRILLPQILRNNLGLVKDVVIVGLINRIMIWHPEQWRKFLTEAKARHEENTGYIEEIKETPGNGRE